ncbi:MAG: tetratricopeptide repeat protein [Patescibacteria group bacterium]|nr:tetratricopeptide repeat protein [Patescibacteria group bacterium]
MMKLPPLHTYIAILALLAIPLFLYSSALPNAFVWDDEEQVVNNPAIQDIHNLPLIFTGSTFSTGGGGLAGSFYRPLVTASYLLSYQLWGTDPWGYHLLQILLHTINTVLVFWILRYLFLVDAKSEDNHATNVWLAFFLAIIFAIHPTHVESVAYVGSIGDVLAGFFALASFALLLKGVREHRIQSHFLWGSIAVGAIGLFAKENAAMIFPIALSYLFFFSHSSKKTLTSYFTGTVIAVAMYLMARLLLARISFGGAPLSPIAEAGFSERLLTIPLELVRYMTLFFFPTYLSVSQHFVVSSLFTAEFLIPVTLLVFIGLLAWRLREIFVDMEKRIFFFGIAWLLFGLLPVLNIAIPLYMTVAERWLYFPMIGALIALGAILTTLARHITTTQAHGIALAIAGIILLCFSLRTTIRIGDWHNGLSLFGHDAQITENSFDLENNYGTELFRVGRFAEAETHFEKSIALQPAWAISRNNLGAIYSHKGDTAHAEEEYRASIAIGNYYLAYENLAGLLIREKRFDEARTLVAQALQVLPSNKNLITLSSSLQESDN